MTPADLLKATLIIGGAMFISHTLDSPETRLRLEKIIHRPSPASPDTSFDYLVAQPAPPKPSSQGDW
jgi:hypothetical protein